MAKTTNTDTKVVLLGTGTPNADPERSGPALAIISNQKAYLFDCGPGVVRRAAAAFEMGVFELEPKKLDIIFLTHLHSDHTLGYPDLILTPWVLERSTPLTVFGPKGTQKLTDHVIEAYRTDIEFRLSGSEPTNITGYKVEVHEIENGIIFEDNNVEITAFPARHGEWPAFGFSVRTQDCKIVISGDTAPNPECLIGLGHCDVLIHEVYSSTGFMSRPEEWQKYHRSMHTSGRELGEIASKMKPNLLILYHQLLWDASVESLIGEVHETFDGTVISGEDLDIFEIS